jgi:Zn-dependent protease with chaperone function
VLAAQYFDGKTAAARAVTLTLDGQELVLGIDEIELRWPLHEVNISERLGNTPRLLTFSGGGHCEVTDHAALDALLASIGARRSWLDGMQQSLTWALVAALLIVVALFASYRYLLPWGAEVIAMRVPGTVLQKMGSSTLETLDRLMLQPSKLDAARQQELREAYARLKPLPDVSEAQLRHGAAEPTGAGATAVRLLPQSGLSANVSEAQLQYRIVFRSSPDLGANAFALPDGSIVMLDELVALTKDDNEIIAVLAHERGHIERRHAMRMVLQSSVVGLVMTWYVGDVSGLLATVPAVVAQAKYSRDMESEADEYAERTLRLNAMSPCLLSGILDKLEAAHLAGNAEEKHADGAGKGDELMDYLSSHPATKERAGLLCPK